MLRQDQRGIETDTTALCLKMETHTLLLLIIIKNLSGVFFAPRTHFLNTRQHNSPHQGSSGLPDVYIMVGKYEAQTCNH